MKNIIKTLILSFLFVFAFTAAKAQEAGTYQGIGPAPGTGTDYQGSQQYPSGNQYQGMQGDQGQMGPSPEDSAKQLAQIKSSMKQMARMVKQFEQMFASAEKKGTAIPEEIKQKLAQLKSILDAVQNASSLEDLQDVDMSEIQGLTESLEDFRRNVIEAQQRMDGMKRAIKGMETGLKFFERQVAALAKKGITVPADIAEHIAKLKSIIEKVKTATSFEDIQEDMESMQDLMETFDQDRQQLEMLARWPQTLKQINQQLTRLASELKRSKVIVDRLAKKGIDIQELYVSFTDAVNKLKSVRDDAVAKMAAGDSDGAFSVLEENFFDQLDNVWQHQRLITMMNNLGRFATEFKQNIARANTTIKNLKRKKVDTSELEALVAQINSKSQEILALIKVADFDEDAIADALNEVENLKQEFEAKVDELTGQEDELPWEKGPSQFKNIDLPKGFDKLIPKKEEPKNQEFPNPVSLWSGDKVSGTTASDSSGGNNGTLSGGVTVAAGKNGNALKFDGSSGLVNMSNPASLNFGTGPFSLEAWVNWDGKGSSVNNIIRKSNYGPDPGSGYWLRIGRDSKTIEFSVGATSRPEGQTLITAPFSPGAWHHVVATRDSSDAVKLYVNGESVGTIVRKATKAESTSESPFTLGAWADQHSEFFSGLIEKAAVYNTALSASEVQAIFNVK